MLQEGQIYTFYIKHTCMSLIILKEIPVFVNLGYNLVFFSIMTIGHDNILLTTYIVEM